MPYENLSLIRLNKNVYSNEQRIFKCIYQSPDNKACFRQTDRQTDLLKNTDIPKVVSNPAPLATGKKEQEKNIKVYWYQAKDLKNCQ